MSAKGMQNTKLL